MYTKERDDVYEDHWNIIDPYGIVVCTTTSEDGADAVLSHLNRG